MYVRVVADHCSVLAGLLAVCVSPPDTRASCRRELVRPERLVYLVPHGRKRVSVWIVSRALGFRVDDDALQDDPLAFDVQRERALSRERHSTRDERKISDAPDANAVDAWGGAKNPRARFRAQSFGYDAVTRVEESDQRAAHGRTIDPVQPDPQLGRCFLT